MPEYPKTESVQETEKRIENMDEWIARMEESSDSESEENQCETEEKTIVNRMEENPALVRESKRMKDQAAQRDIKNLIKQLSLGNENPGIGTTRVKGLKNVSEARARNEGRVYFREKNGKIEILATSNKDNQNKVIGILQKMGY